MRSRSHRKGLFDMKEYDMLFCYPYLTNGHNVIQAISKEIARKK